MVFVTIRAEGLDQRIAELNRVLRDHPNSRRTVLQNTSKFMESELKKNAHVSEEKPWRRGFHMRDLIRVTTVNEREAIVNVPVPYAVYENARGGSKSPTSKSAGPYGPHNFADRAEAATRIEFARQIQQEYDRLFTSL